MKRRTFIIMLAIAMMLASAIPALNPGAEVFATSRSGILNNGSNGIYIDINAAPFTTFANQHPKTSPYGPEGCGWYASSRAKQFNSKVTTVWNGEGWWSNRNTLGYGSGGRGEIQEHALICYKRQPEGWSHVAFVEKIIGDKVVVSEGGNKNSDANHGYCIIKETTVNKIETGTDFGIFQGYVYTQNKEKTFTVKYNANGGYGSMANTTHIYGGDVKLRKNAFVRDGYTFNGWNIYMPRTDKWSYTNGSTSAFYKKGSQPAGYWLRVLPDQQTVGWQTDVDKDTIVMYAVWKNNTFTIKYNANGGSGSMADTAVTYDIRTNLRTNTFVRDGYRFDGWYIYQHSSNKWNYENGAKRGWYYKDQQPEGYTLRKYADGQSVYQSSTVDKDTIELFAVWTPVPVTPDDDTSDVKPDHQHSYGKWTTVKAATELASGTQTRKCSVCGNVEAKAIAKLKPSLKAVDILTPKAAKKSATVKWKKVSKKNQKKIAKIEIQYSTDKNFKKNVKTVYAKKSATSKKITKLMSKKTYCVRVRAYKKTGGVVHISKWSTRKTVKIK